MWIKIEHTFKYLLRADSMSAILTCMNGVIKKYSGIVWNPWPNKKKYVDHPNRPPLEILSINKTGGHSIRSFFYCARFFADPYLLMYKILYYCKHIFAIAAVEFSTQNGNGTIYLWSAAESDGAACGSSYQYLLSVEKWLSYLFILPKVATFDGGMGVNFTSRFAVFFVCGLTNSSSER